MNTQVQVIKYRLIGALVLLFILGITWATFFDNDVKRYQESKRDIPEPLAIQRFDVAKPEPVKEIQAAVKPLELVPVDTTKKPVQTQTVAEVKEKPVDAPIKNSVAHDANGQAIAYVVQAGSFSSEENARNLQAQMLKKELPAYVKKATSSKGVLYRVFLGPKLSKAHAETLLQQVKKEFQLQGQILRYQAGYEE